MMVPDEFRKVKFEFEVLIDALLSLMFRSRIDTLTLPLKVKLSRRRIPAVSPKVPRSTMKVVLKKLRFSEGVATIHSSSVLRVLSMNVLLRALLENPNAFVDECAVILLFET